MDFQLAGLASGFDWKSMVDQLMQIERIPQQRMLQEQSKNTDKLTALGQLETKLGALNGKMTSMKTSSLFNTKSASLANADVNISASATTSASIGTYQFNVSQLATTTRRTGSADVGGSMGDENTVITNLRLKDDITEGTFTVNGQEVTVSSTDTLQDIFDAISAATSGVVSASYDALTDKVSLTSSSGQLDLGAEDDDSNFLAAMKLDQLEVIDAGGGNVSVASSKALGVVDMSNPIATSGIGGGSVTGAGTFFINGVQIDFDADTESMQALVNKVNSSKAGVTMTYDTTADQFRIVNKETGAYAMNVTDSGNGLLAALGLDGSAVVGTDLQFTVDGGALQTSRSNTITSADHGLEGLTVKAFETGSQTITVANDSKELGTKISEFISAFNDVQDFIQEKTKITVKDNKVTAGVLASNREVSALSQQLRSLAFTAIGGMSGDLFRLEHMGIDFISDTAKLEVKDSSKLESALASKLGALETFFSTASTGFASRMETYLTGYTASKGILDTQKGNLTAANTKIDTDIKEMERRLTFKKAALEAGFIAMEEAQSRIQNQASALAGLSAGFQ